MYVCLIAVIIAILIYAYITSEYYYINAVLKSAFDQLNDGDAFREYDGQYSTIDQMEHFEECEPLEDEQIEAMIDAAYGGAQ